MIPEPPGCVSNRARAGLRSNPARVIDSKLGKAELAELCGVCVSEWLSEKTRTAGTCPSEPPRPGGAGGQGGWGDPGRDTKWHGRETPTAPKGRGAWGVGVEKKASGGSGGRAKGEDSHYVCTAAKPLAQ